MHPEKAKAIITRLGGKDRTRRLHRPSFWLGQFSLAALLTTTTVVSVVLAISHYRGAEIEIRARVDAQMFPQTPADEFVPVAVVLTCSLLAVAIGYVVFRLPPERGLFVIWFLACLAVLGLVLATNLPVQPLAGTKLRQLTVDQVVPAALWGLSCLLPLGSAVGWYVKFATADG